MEAGRKLFEPVDGDWVVTNICDMNFDRSYRTVTIINETLFSLDEDSAEKIIVSLVEIKKDNNDVALELSVVKDIEIEQPIAKIEELP